MIPRVLEDPRAYPREAMLLAAIAALSLILVVLMVMGVNDAVREGLYRRRMGVRRQRRTRLVPLAVAVAATIVLLAVASQAPTLPATAELCAACHEIGPAVTAWRADVHSAVGCYGCHAAPGVSGALVASLNGAGRRLRSDEHAATSVHPASCLRCHDTLGKRIVGSTIRVRHADIIATGTFCTECHPDIGHSSLKRDSKFIRSVMSRCLICHDDKIAPAACETCHVSGPLDSARTPQGATAMAGGVCSDCHSRATQARCVDCHGLELPHPVTFMRRHASLSFAEPALCAKCHETASASSGCTCHSMQANEHGTYEEWFQEHGARAAFSGPGGCLCHNDGGYIVCAACHERYPWSE